MNQDKLVGIRNPDSHGFGFAVRFPSPTGPCFSQDLPAIRALHLMFQLPAIPQ